MDIHSKSPYPAGALSNFTAFEFVVDGVLCQSMEGFFQSLKFSDLDVQKDVCQLVGGDAKDKGLDQDWKKDQTLYWQGTPIDRHSQLYTELLIRAYDALFENVHFKAALTASMGHRLEHSIGLAGKSETVLTELEFIDQLNRLRAQLEPLD